MMKLFIPHIKSMLNDCIQLKRKLGWRDSGPFVGDVSSESGRANFGCFSEGGLSGEFG